MGVFVQSGPARKSRGSPRRSETSDPGPAGATTPAAGCRLNASVSISIRRPPSRHVGQKCIFRRAFSQVRGGRPVPSSRSPPTWARRSTPATTAEPSAPAPTLSGRRSRQVCCRKRPMPARAFTGRRLDRARARQTIAPGHEASRARAPLETIRCRSLRRAGPAQGTLPRQADLIFGIGCSSPRPTSASDSPEPNHQATLDPATSTGCRSRSALRVTRSVLEAVRGEVHGRQGRQSRCQGTRHTSLARRSEPKLTEDAAEPRVLGISRRLSTSPTPSHA
jgi:hypothetical protein